MGHIPTKLHRYMIGSIRDFVQTERQTDSTDAAKSNIGSQHARR